MMGEQGSHPKKLSYSKRWFDDSDLEALPLRRVIYPYEEVDFSQNSLSVTGLRKVLDLCLRCEKLRVLKLYKNNIDDAGAELIAGFLKKCCTIEEIHLSHNHFTDVGVSLIATAGENSRKSHMNPLWLRLEQNDVHSPRQLVQRLQSTLSLCARMDSQRCTVHACAEGCKVHLPHFHFQRGRPDHDCHGAGAWNESWDEKNWGWWEVSGWGGDSWDYEDNNYGTSRWYTDGAHGDCESDWGTKQQSPSPKQSKREILVHDEHIGRLRAWGSDDDDDSVDREFTMRRRSVISLKAVDTVHASVKDESLNCCNGGSHRVVRCDNTPGATPSRLDELGYMQRPALELKECPSRTKKDDTGSNIQSEHSECQGPKCARPPPRKAVIPRPTGTASTRERCSNCVGRRSRTPSPRVCGKRKRVVKEEMVSSVRRRRRLEPSSAHHTMPSWHARATRHPSIVRRPDRYRIQQSSRFYSRSPSVRRRPLADHRRRRLLPADRRRKNLVFGRHSAKAPLHARSSVLHGSGRHPHGISSRLMRYRLPNEDRRHRQETQRLRSRERRRIHRKTRERSCGRTRVHHSRHCHRITRIPRKQAVRECHDDAILSRTHNSPTLRKLASDRTQKLVDKLCGSTASCTKVKRRVDSGALMEERRSARGRHRSRQTAGEAGSRNVPERVPTVAATCPKQVAPQQVSTPAEAARTMQVKQESPSPQSASPVCGVDALPAEESEYSSYTYEEWEEEEEEQEDEQQEQEQEEHEGSHATSSNL